MPPTTAIPNMWAVSETAAEGFTPSPGVPASDPKRSRRRGIEGATVFAIARRAGSAISDLPTEPKIFMSLATPTLV